MRNGDNIVTRPRKKKKQNEIMGVNRPLNIKALYKNNWLFYLQKYFVCWRLTIKYNTAIGSCEQYTFQYKVRSKQAFLKGSIVSYLLLSQFCVWQLILATKMASILLIRLGICFCTCWKRKTVNYKKKEERKKRDRIERKEFIIL